MGKSMRAYQQDLAYIHDVSFCYSQQAAPGLLHILRRAGIEGGMAVDLGCGGGVWARILADKGFQVLGVDCSASLLEIAKARVPEGTFVRRSFLKMKLPACDLVTALGEVFNYQFDKDNDWDNLTAFFKRVYQALRPGGLLVFDVAEPGRCPPHPKTFTQGRDWICLVEAREDKSARTLERRITSLRKVGDLYRRSEEVHHLRLYRGVDLARCLREMGFRVRILKGYGDFHFVPRYNAYVGIAARKPAR